jgi:hypothetical protein
MKIIVVLAIVALACWVIAVGVRFIYAGLRTDPEIAAQVRRRRADARWQVDDTGVAPDGQAEMAIELIHPAVMDPYERRVIGTYAHDDHGEWGRRWAEAIETASTLNDALDRGARTRRR